MVLWEECPLSLSSSIQSSPLSSFQTPRDTALAPIVCTLARCFALLPATRPANRTASKPILAKRPRGLSNCLAPASRLRNTRDIVASDHAATYLAASAIPPVSALTSSSTLQLPRPSVAGGRLGVVGRCDAIAAPAAASRQAHAQRLVPKTSLSASPSQPAW